MRRRLRWFTDWRNGAVIAASILAAAFLFFVVDASRSRHQALDALKANSAQSIDTREAQSRRIDMLSRQVEVLTGEVINLRELLAGAGVDPPPRTTTTMTAAPRRSTTATTARRPPASTTTTQRPSPTTTAPPPTTTSPPPPTTTTTTTPCRAPIPGVCL